MIPSKNKYAIKVLLFVFGLILCIEFILQIDKITILSKDFYAIKNPSIYFKLIDDVVSIASKYFILSIFVFLFWRCSKIEINFYETYFTSLFTYLFDFLGIAFIASVIYFKLFYLKYIILIFPFLMPLFQSLYISFKYIYRKDGQFSGLYTIFINYIIILFSLHLYELLRDSFISTYFNLNQ